MYPVGPEKRAQLTLMIIYMKMLVRRIVVYMGAKKGVTTSRISMSRTKAVAKAFLDFLFIISICLFSQDARWPCQKQDHEDDVIGDQ